jgi:hypothetical protein
LCRTGIGPSPPTLTSNASAVMTVTNRLTGPA